MELTDGLKDILDIGRVLADYVIHIFLHVSLCNSGFVLKQGNGTL